MKREPALLRWIYTVVGVAMTTLSFSMPGGQARDAIHLAAALQLLPVVVFARWRNRLSWYSVALMGSVGGFYALRQLAADGSPTYAAPIAAVFALAAGVCLVIGLASLLRSGGDRYATGLWGDATIVAIGSWIVSWAVIVEPVRKLADDSWRAALSGLYQPTTWVALFLAAVVMLSRHRRPTAMWLAGAGLALNLLADLIYSLLDAGHIGSGTARLAIPFYVAAYFCAGAAFLHPSISELGRPQPIPAGDSIGRLIATIASLVVPVIVLAATAPNNTADKVVRSVSTFVLACVVTTRVLVAVRTNRRDQVELLHGAHTDPLTGLPNRTVLLQTINDLLRNSWHPDDQPTLFFVDLDRFKNINDSLGHAAGDEVLVTVARRLVNAVSESATVSRLSGDEYVVLDVNAKSPAGALEIAERLLAVFREPLALSQGDVFVTASIGVAAISPTSSSSPEDLVRHADTAMYRAKDAGRNCVAVYDESMHERVAHRLAVETALYRALDRRELRLFHQPILDLQSGDVVGVEALMRWQQADGTIVSPAEFIPIAEDTGTIIPIGSWALLEALTQLRSWIDDGVCSPSATMSVNVSPRQLADSNFPAVVGEALSRSGVSPQLLWLEVTESVMITEPELALATLRRMRSLGVRVALDDFGTGYSSLSLLQKFPLQRIKIDRAFVQGVADNPNDRSLVRTIVAMGRSLGLDIVAEGVESVHQLQVLSDLGCDKAQGYLISHPVPADAMRSTVAALERLGRFPGLRVENGAPTR
ncbi:MAG: EAL domain-containing protein [Actinobacteria bacterium]|nr:EAL domain-containing protein [Actinomycetota bacterium]